MLIYVKLFNELGTFYMYLDGRIIQLLEVNCYLCWVLVYPAGQGPHFEKNLKSNFNRISHLLTFNYFYNLL